MEGRLELDDADSSDTPLERWAPLGAVADPSSSSLGEDSRAGAYATDEVDALRDENEKMSNSLLSLTSHFAQVQFRLKQIVEGPDDMKLERLKELELFAERGIPDVKSCIVPNAGTESSQEDADDEYKKRLSGKQREMIHELKIQLSELESYAYESGVASELPTSKMMEKQEIIIQEMKRRLQLSHLDNLASLSADELKECINEALAQIINPSKAKDKQLEQLRTQVTDLERFIDFLQDEVTNAKKTTDSSGPTTKQLTPEYLNSGTGSLPSRVRTQGTGSSDKGEAEDSRSSRVKKMVSVVALFLLRELGCASRQNDRQKNEMKARAAEPHYGDMLAEMQLAVDKLVDTAEKVRQEQEDSVFTDCDYLSDDEAYVAESKALTQCVRKSFAICLGKLIEHGCMERSTSRALMPLTACASRNSVMVKTTPVHAWKVILAYYELKDGKAFNEAPLRKLADSFGLEPSAAAAAADSETAATVKQTLLRAIGHVIETHTPYQRSDDAHFKAFVSLSLNEKKLVPWLRQILRTGAVVDRFYEPWSYLVRTNFEDAFCSMNKLKLYDFNLPVDLAVKQLTNINDAF